jgi:hypothetical protein
MGHLNYRDLRQLQHLAEGVTLDKSVLGDCPCCIQSKSHRRNYQISKSHAKRFGDLVHSDICYIGIETILGEYTMFVLLISEIGCNRRIQEMLLTS